MHYFRLQGIHGHEGHNNFSKGAGHYSCEDIIHTLIGHYTYYIIIPYLERPHPSEHSQGKSHVICLRLTSPKIPYKL